MVGVKGTWAGLPHSAQTTSWSSLARPVPRTLRLIDRQSGQRDGSCWNPLAEYNCCSPTVKTKLRPQSRHVKVLSLKLTANLLFFVFGSQSLAGAIRLAFDPLPGRDYSKRQVSFGDGLKGPRSGVEKRGENQWGPAPAWKSGEKIQRGPAP